MKLLILGSNGFVGRNLVEQLSKGNHDILAPKRDTLDLVDQDAVEDYLKANRPDVVINCAVTITSVETNLHIYYNIERCAQYFGRLLNVGSGAEYAPKYYIPMMQESYFGKNIPGDTYGISKFCIAKDIERSPHDFINLRVFGIFGEYEDHSRRFISNNICSSIREHTITVNRNSVFDYLDVMDFVRIVERFLTLDNAYKSYNVCTSQPQALVDLAAVIDQVSPYSNTVTMVDKNVFSTYVGDNSRLIAAIGEFDFTPVETSVGRLFDWYQAEFDAGRIR